MEPNESWLQYKKKKGDQRKRKTIICPIDGSELSDIAEKQAVSVSKMSGAKIILTYVVEKWYRSTYLATDSKEWQKLHKEWLEEGKELLKKEAAKLEAMGMKNVETILRDGDAAHEIVALATEQQADLIVMATHRYSSMGKLFKGSVTDRVSQKSPCPVLWVFK